MDELAVAELELPLVEVEVLDPVVAEPLELDTEKQTFDSCQTLPSHW